MGASMENDQRIKTELWEKREFSNIFGKMTLGVPAAGVREGCHIHILRQFCWKYPNTTNRGFALCSQKSERSCNYNLTC